MRNRRALACEAGAFISSLAYAQSLAPSSSAADLLDWSDDIGAVEAGKFADLIAMQGDPIADITILQHVKFVMKGGRVVKNELAH